MGTCISLCVGPSMPRVQYDFLALSRYDIAKLSDIYCAMKRNKNGFVDISNVLKYFKIEQNVFMENAFMLLNRTEAKDFPLLNFEEFVYLTWNYSSCDNLGEWRYASGLQSEYICKRPQRLAVNILCLGVVIVQHSWRSVSMTLIVRMT